MRPLKKRFSPLAVAAAVAVSAAWLGGAAGCESQPKSGKVKVITIQGDAERLAEAQRLAASAQTMRDPEAAIARYREAVAAFSDFPAAWNNLGVLLLRERRYREAAEAFVVAGERAPTDPRPLFNLGLAWDRAGYLADALEHYSSALDRDPNFLPALRGAIRAERRLGRATEKTIARLRIALMAETDPQWREYFELQRSWAEAEVAGYTGMPAEASVESR